MKLPGSAKRPPRTGARGKILPSQVPPGVRTVPTPSDGARRLVFTASIAGSAGANTAITAAHQYQMDAMSGTPSEAMLEIQSGVTVLDQVVATDAAEGVEAERGCLRCGAWIPADDLFPRLPGLWQRPRAARHHHDGAAGSPSRLDDENDDPPSWSMPSVLDGCRYIPARGCVLSARRGDSVVHHRIAGAPLRYFCDVERALRPMDFS